MLIFTAWDAEPLASVHSAGQQAAGKGFTGVFHCPVPLVPHGTRWDSEGDRPTCIEPDQTRGSLEMKHTTWRGHRGHAALLNSGCLLVEHGWCLIVIFQ